jgi:hypothetical protein
MNGFRNLVLVMLACVVLGLWLSRGPSACQPPDAGHCVWNVDLHRYNCPEEK